MSVCIALNVALRVRNDEAAEAENEADSNLAIEVRGGFMILGYTKVVVAVLEEIRSMVDVEGVDDITDDATAPE